MRHSMAMTLATTVLVTLMTALVVHVEHDDLSNSSTCDLGYCACARARMCVSVPMHCVCMCVEHDEHEAHRSSLRAKYAE